MEKDPLYSARSRLASATRFGNVDAARAARRDLTAATLARHIDKALAAEPALTTEQRTTLAARLAPNGED